VLLGRGAGLLFVKGGIVHEAPGWGNKDLRRKKRERRIGGRGPQRRRGTPERFLVEVAPLKKKKLSDPV